MYVDKEQLRKLMLEKRNALSCEFVEKSGVIILEKLKRNQIIKQGDCVFLYVDMRNELPTRNIINYCLANNIKVCVPRIEDLGSEKVMKAYVIDSLEKDLEIAAFGIMEPVFRGKAAAEREMDIANIDVVLAPGLAFDVDGNRIGYGGGYYDKFLSRNIAVDDNSTIKKPLKIGVCYDFQVIDRIESDEFDVKMDLVLTV